MLAETIYKINQNQNLKESLIDKPQTAHILFENLSLEERNALIAYLEYEHWQTPTNLEFSWIRRWGVV